MEERLCASQGGAGMEGSLLLCADLDGMWNCPRRTIVTCAS